MAAKDCISVCCVKCGAPRTNNTHPQWCSACYNSWRREWRQKNSEKIQAQKERALQRNPDIFKQYDRRSYWKNRKKRIAKSRRWNVENKEIFAAREAARRGAQRAATPAWIDIDAIRMVYVEAARITEETGVLHHVDHIVPLKSKIVCGLHAVSNLRVISAFDNQSKSNRYWPDMPE